MKDIKEFKNSNNCEYSYEFKLNVVCMMSYAPEYLMEKCHSLTSEKKILLIEKAKEKLKEFKENEIPQINDLKLNLGIFLVFDQEGYWDDREWYM